MHLPRSTSYCNFDENYERHSFSTLELSPKNIAASRRNFIRRSVQNSRKVERNEK